MKNQKTDEDIKVELAKSGEQPEGRWTTRDAMERASSSPLWSTTLKRIIQQFIQRHTMKI